MIVRYRNESDTRRMQGSTPGELKYFEPEDIDSCDIDQIEDPFGRVKITKSFSF